MKINIEKLGITREWFPAFNLICNRITNNKNGVLFESDDDCTVEDFICAVAAPEMLEALIKFLLQMESIVVPENTKYKKDYYDNFLKTYDSLIKPVEKATGKSLSEIKELLNA